MITNLRLTLQDINESIAAFGHTSTETIHLFKNINKFDMIIYHDRASKVPTPLLNRIQTVISNTRPIGLKQPMFLTGGFEDWEILICKKSDINTSNHIEIGDGFGISKIKLDVQKPNVLFFSFAFLL